MTGPGAPPSDRAAPRGAAARASAPTEARSRPCGRGRPVRFAAAGRPRRSAGRSEHADADRGLPGAVRVHRQPAAQPRQNAAVARRGATQPAGAARTGPGRSAVNSPPTLAASRCCTWCSQTGPDRHTRTRAGRGSRASSSWLPKGCLAAHRRLPRRERPLRRQILRGSAWFGTRPSSAADGVRRRGAVVRAS